jgi:hypothetical protein
MDLILHIVDMMGNLGVKVRGAGAVLLWLEACFVVGSLPLLACAAVAGAM